ncbi:MAG TPA: hypothetical protein VGP72_32265 [Planctomycetota bacterium]|jgi:hypothetical protein
MNDPVLKVWLPASRASLQMRRRPLYLKAIPFVALALLAVIGWFIHHTVEQAMKEDMASDLETVLKADVSALRLWIEAQGLATEQVAHDEEIHALCLALLEQSKKRPDWQFATLSGQDLKHLRELFAPRLEANG